MEGFVVCTWMWWFSISNLHVTRGNCAGPYNRPKENWGHRSCTKIQTAYLLSSGTFFYTCSSLSKPKIRCTRNSTADKALLGWIISRISTLCGGYDFHRFLCWVAAILFHHPCHSQGYLSLQQKLCKLRGQKGQTGKVSSERISLMVLCIQTIIWWD